MFTLVANKNRRVLSDVYNVVSLLVLIIFSFSSTSVDQLFFDRRKTLGFWRRSNYSVCGKAPPGLIQLCRPVPDGLHEVVWYWRVYETRGRFEFNYQSNLHPAIKSILVAICYRPKHRLGQAWYRTLVVGHDDPNLIASACIFCS